MKRILPFAAVATAASTLLLMSGCASVAETSATANADNKCKVALAQPARINYDPAKATDMDKSEARAKLASLQLNRPVNRLGNNPNGTVEQALRDCQ